MIEVKNLKKSYGTVKAVEDVSFKINTGEIVGILGPNGAGKTTTLNMITGVLLPDSGEVLIEDHDLRKDTRRLKSHIGYLAEDNPLYRDMLVEELLSFTSQMRGITKNDFAASIDKIVNVTGIKEIYYRPIASLSKGLRQRVGMAQALLGDPKILILDEPTEGLDPNQRQEIRKLITTLGKDHTVLLSTHVMQEVEALCERVIILHRGKVVASGSVAEITQVQEGMLSVELSVGGDKTVVANALREKFEVSDVADKTYSVSFESDRQDEFYKLIAQATDESSYLTSLKTKQTNLEDVFSSLTKD